MIILLIALWSFSAIYFTHLLFVKKMKVAAGLLATLYVYVLLWVYLLFVIDIGGVGFNLTVLRGNSILYGDVYRAFNAIAVNMNSLSNEYLISIVVISILIAFSSILVVLDGSVRISKEIYNRISKYFASDIINNKEKLSISLRMKQVLFNNTPIIRMNCRANC